jgi:hypothetical protein
MLLAMATPLAAQAQWVETSIDHFSSESNIPTWTDGSCGAFKARINIPKAQLPELAGVAINNGSECVRFNWKGAQHYVRLNSVTLVNTKQVGVPPCRSVAAAQSISPNTRSAAPMGNGKDIRPQDCR